MTVTMPRPKTPPERIPLFRGLVLNARAIGGDFISQGQYWLLERAFIAAQGRPGSPAFLWGWGHQRLLKDALKASGVSVKPHDSAQLHPFALERNGFSRLQELEEKIKKERPNSQ